MQVTALQREVVKIGTEVFGEANVKDKHERAQRFFEEACELIRSLGMPYAEACALLAHEYHDRKVGEPPQEMAGVQCTLMSLADAHGIDIELVTLRELHRVLVNKDQCRAKHDAKKFTTMKVSA